MVGGRGMLRGKLMPLTSHERRRTQRLAVAALLALCLVPVSAQTPSATARQSWNFIDRVILPPDQQDPMTTQIVARLASGVVKTAADARFRPFRAKVGPGEITGRVLRADELPYMTGLFFMETGVLQIDGVPQRTRDLVWEVTVVGAGVRAVFWISAQTGVVTQIFPAAN